MMHRKFSVLITGSVDDAHPNGWVDENVTRIEGTDYTKLHRAIVAQLMRSCANTVEMDGKILPIERGRYAK